MLKNSFKSILIHISIGFVSLLIFDIEGEVIGNILGYSKISYGSIHALIAVLIFFAALILYFILARKYLEKFSIVKSIFSVLLVAIIGAALWFISYILHFSNKDLDSGILKLYYQIYNAYSLPLFAKFNIESPVLAGTFVIIPSLLMWIGIQSKSDGKSYF